MLEESLTARQFELGGQYELVEREGDGLGVAFRGIYEFALENGEPDEILFGPLAKYVWGPDSATINTFFIGQVGNNVGIDSLELQVNWRLKHEFSDTFALGVEGYSQIDDLSHAGTFDQQKHRLGPVAYFEFEDRLPQMGVRRRHAVRALGRDVRRDLQVRRRGGILGFSAAMMAFPISRVPTVLQPSCLMSAVRKPWSSTSAMAFSIASAASPRSKE